MGEKKRDHDEVLFGARWTLCCHCNGRRLPSLPHSCGEVCGRTFLETVETRIPVCPRRCVRGCEGWACSGEIVSVVMECITSIGTGNPLGIYQCVMDAIGAGSDCADCVCWVMSFVGVDC